jgi:predicted nucleic acid-binding protein
MTRAVFDTNVIVSGLLSPDGPPGRIVEWLRAGTIQAVLDDRVAAEYAEVLTRPRFGLPPAEVAVASRVAHQLIPVPVLVVEPSRHFRRRARWTSTFQIAFQRS